MKIAVDAMGGDYAPGEVVAGAVKWAIDTGSQIILVGKKDIIGQELNKHAYGAACISIVNAEQVINMDESPALALRKKKDASIIVATKLVKEGAADAIVSCGSTGAQMAAALFIFGRMAGIERPPIGTLIPNENESGTLLMDIGANVDCKPSQLLQFAVLGSAYAAAVNRISSPRIALLNNGEEEGKGNTASVEAYSLMKQQKNLNFIGNIEGRDLFNNTSDVIICDGFTGNIVLKTMEGLAIYIAKLISKELQMTPRALTELDHANVGGAPLLGIKGISIVCHGSSKRNSVYNGINTARDCVEKDIIKTQEEAIKTML